MSIFSKTDPKDDLIAALIDERNYLRVKLDELQKELLAVHNAHAFRLMHRPPGTESPAKPAEPSIYDLRNTEFKPDFSLQKLEQQVKGRIVD